MAGNLLGEHPLHEDAVTNTNNIYLSNLYAQVYDGLLTFNQRTKTEWVWQQYMKWNTIYKKCKFISGKPERHSPLFAPIGF